LAMSIESCDEVRIAGVVVPGTGLFVWFNVLLSVWE